MAEFGPRVFHALANCVDNDLKSVDPVDVGLLLKENDIQDTTSAMLIEELKNAIFKLVMLRARNTLARMDPASAKPIAEAVGIPVTLNITFHPSAIHPLENATTKNREEFELRTLGVNGIQVAPDIFADSLDQVGVITQDIQSLLLRFRTLSAACGSQNDLTNAFSGDTLFETLWKAPSE